MYNIDQDSIETNIADISASTDGGILDLSPYCSTFLYERLTQIKMIPNDPTSIINIEDSIAGEMEVIPGNASLIINIRSNLSALETTPLLTDSAYIHLVRANRLAGISTNNLPGNATAELSVLPFGFGILELNLNGLDLKVTIENFNLEEGSTIIRFSLDDESRTLDANQSLLAILACVEQMKNYHMKRFGESIKLLNS